MKDSEIENLAKELAKKHYHLKIEWLKTCIEYLEETLGTKIESRAHLISLIIHQFLNSPISETFEPTMKVPVGAAKVFIVKRMIFQLQSYLNVSSSLYEQLTDCMGRSSDLRWFHGENEEKSEEESDGTHNQQTKRKRGMLKLELTDGVNCLKGIEIEEVFDEKMLTPGAKILLTGRVKCRRGTLLLEKSTCQLLGGHVESLKVDKTKQLAELLKIDLDAEKKRRKESLEKVAEQRKAAKQKKNEQKSMNQSSLSPFLMKTDRKTGETTNAKITASMKMKSGKEIVVQNDSFDEEIQELPPPLEPTPEPPEQQEVDPFDSEFQQQQSMGTSGKPAKSKSTEKTVEDWTFSSFESSSKSSKSPEKPIPSVEIPRKQPKKTLPLQILKDEQRAQCTAQETPRAERIPAVSSFSKRLEIKNPEEKKNEDYATIMGFPPCFFPDKEEISHTIHQKSKTKANRSFEKMLHGPRKVEIEERITHHFPSVKSPRIIGKHVEDVEEEEEDDMRIVESILSEIQQKSHKQPEEPEQQLEEISATPEYEDSIMECTLEKEGQMELQRWGLDERVRRKRDADRQRDEISKKKGYSSLMALSSEPVVFEQQSSFQAPPIFKKSIKKEMEEMMVMKRKVGGVEEQEIKNRQSANVQVYRTPFAKRIPSTDFSASSNAKLHERMSELSIVLLGDALINRKFWMMSKIVVVMPTICHQVHELKSDGIDWLLQMSVSDTSAANIFCNVATDLLNRIFGFTVQQCKNLFNAKQIDELRMKKLEAERKLAGFKRLDLVMWMEVSPDPHKIPLIVDVKTISDALNIL